MLAPPPAWPGRWRAIRRSGHNRRSVRTDPVLRTTVQRRSLTRRRALGLGAAAVAATALRPSPSLALARRPTAFAQDLPDALGQGARASAWHTLPVVRAPHRFDLLGLRWPAGARVRAEVRARRR